MKDADARIYSKDYLYVKEERIAGLPYGFLVHHEDLDESCNIVGCFDSLEDAKACIVDYVAKDRARPQW